MPQEPLNLELEGELQLKSRARRLDPTTEAAEPQTPKGGELFIVDNSDSEWKGLKYLHDWTEIASAFDIATGFFEIGALLALQPGAIAVTEADDTQPLSYAVPQLTGGW